ncbi:hypothetical protein [Haloprofundus halobius]|uniref:hypothetical protein n=1 Tax=Haloprofundus halobius TaxID=2876194 RepID=UPI001CCC0AAA|nr:hypothetical protein [Haloprofundus halobius]
MVSDSPSRRGYLSALGAAAVTGIGARSANGVDGAEADVTSASSLTDWPMPRYDAADNT